MRATFLSIISQSNGTKGEKGQHSMKRELAVPIYTVTPRAEMMASIAHNSYSNNF